MISHEIIQFHPSDEESGESYDLRVEVRAVRHCGGDPCIARGREGVTIFHQDTFPSASSGMHLKEGIYQASLPLLLLEKYGVWEKIVLDRISKEERRLEDYEDRTY